VIQTGDNSGTGDGGPGYSIRTEISPVRYDDEGAVGMASSGKDTEGSQWFVTHCPTPHLNTRYTIWGEIVKGRENIEKYLLNDQIINVIPYK
jgi:cyclophilin family peptidyl-prolyl cis-trans isomerase